MDPWVNFEEAAKQLGTTERALRTWIALRRIDYNKNGKFIRFRQSVLDAFNEQNTVQALPRKGVASVTAARKTGAA